MEAFLDDDDSLEAFGRVVDRLLASPHYGERWGRYWLDLARYSDGRIGAREDTPYPNAHRYRDWVVHAFNQDLPYDRFISAQLAADLLPSEEREELLAGLGFLVLAPSQDDLVDVTARSFMGLTVGCARCHDHKYDPIPTQDFYSLKGVFASSEVWEYPLVDEQIVETYKKAEEKVSKKKDSIQKFIKSQSEQLADILLEQTSSYMVAAWKVLRGQQPSPQAAAEDAQLDLEVVNRWIKYLDQAEKEHPYLKDWEAMVARGGSLKEATDLADPFQEIVLTINLEKKELEDRNYVKLGGAKGAADMGTRQYANLEFLDLQKWYLWRDLAAEPHPRGSFRFEGGVVYYGSEEGLEIDRFLTGEWKKHLDRMRKELKRLEEAVPEPYPFLHGYRDLEKPKDLRIAIRGDKDNLGPQALSTRPQRRGAGDLQSGQWAAGTGPGHRQPGESVDGSCHGQSRLAAPFRAGNRPHSQQSRAAGSQGKPSQAAGLSGGKIHSDRLVDQGPSPGDHAFRDLRLEFAAPRRERREGSGQPSAVAREPDPEARRRGPTSHHSRGFRKAGSNPGRSISSLGRRPSPPHPLRSRQSHQTRPDPGNV